MIYVKDQPRDNMGAFSHKFRLIAEMIVGGGQWLRFALHSQKDTFVVLTEPELLALVQKGLHDSPHMVLSRLDLLVNPMKLWGLPDDDLALLATARKEASVLDVLARHALADYTSLDFGTEFVHKLEVGHEPPFRVMDLADRLSLLGLALEMELWDQGKPPTVRVQREAAGFAVYLAQNAGAFADQFRFYLALWGKHESGRKSGKKRAELAWEDYNGLCDPWMETITLGRGYDAMDLSLEIKNALAGNFQLGFSNKASAMHNFVANTALDNQPLPEARRIVGQYMSNVASFIGSGKVNGTEVTQDGITRLHFISSLWVPGDEVRVDVNRQGVVTVNWARVNKPL